MEQKVTSHITKGLLVALIVIVIDLAGHFAGLKLEQWYGFVSLAIMIGLIVWSTMLYGKECNNNVTFGALFADGFKTTAVYTCIYFVYTLLVIYLLFPNFMDELIQKGLDDAAKKGQELPEMTEEGMAMAKKITTMISLAGAVLGSLIIGAIGAVIGAAVTRKKPKDPFAQPLT